MAFTEGRAAAAPILRRAAAGFVSSDVSVQEILRWGWLATAASVMVWDYGTWEPVGDPHSGMSKGKLLFKLHGQKLAGLWELVRISKPGDKQDQWMLFKKRDAWARPLAEYD